MLRYTVLWIGLFLSIPIYAQTPASFIQVEVVPKQSFYSLARDYSIDVKILKKYNEKFAPEYLLKIGDIVKIPIFSAAATPTKTTATTAPQPTANKITHTVIKGESVYSIAKKYSASISNLKKWNNLDAEMKIKIGQKLIVSNENATPQPPKQAVATTKVAEKIIETPKPTEKKPSPVAPTKPATDAIASDALYEPATKSKEEETIVVDLVPETKAVKTAPKKIEEKLVVEPNLKATVNPTTNIIMRGIGKVSMAPELTSSSFAYYNNANVGETVKVVNLMSKRIFYMKIIGKIPASENDGETIILVSPDALKNLGASDNRFLVEISSK